MCEQEKITKNCLFPLALRKTASTQGTRLAMHCSKDLSPWHPLQSCWCLLYPSSQFFMKHIYSRSIVITTCHNSAWLSIRMCVCCTEMGNFAPIILAADFEPLEQSENGLRIVKRTAIIQNKRVRKKVRPWKKRKSQISDAPLLVVEEVQLLRSTGTTLHRRKRQMATFSSAPIASFRLRHDTTTMRDRASSAIGSNVSCEG